MKVEWQHDIFIYILIHIYFDFVEWHQIKWNVFMYIASWYYSSADVNLVIDKNIERKKKNKYLVFPIQLM